MDLQARFESNLIMAQDDEPDASLEEQLRMARDWTIEEVTQEIAQMAERRHCLHQEAVNWHTYEERSTPSFIELMTQDNHFLGA